MKHMSGLDSLFLHIETKETPMHVGSLNLVQLPTGFKGRYHEAVKKHVASRMHLAPALHRKLANVPLDVTNPIWIEADDLDLDDHIRRMILPKPGSMAQLEKLVGQLHGKLLDRKRPLWEFTVIEGLQNGQMAFYSKVHHAAVDGQAAVALANAILDLGPEPRKIDAPAKRGGRGKPKMGSLVGAAFENVVTQTANTVKSLPELLKTGASMLLGAASKGSALRSFSFGPRTSMNVAITEQRGFSTASLPLAEVKAIGRHFGATLNDVVMAICSGALRHYLQKHEALPERSLIAAVPMSLREAGNTDQSNQVSMMLCSLATDIEDPRERLRAVCAASTASKEMMSGVNSVMPTDFPSLGVPWLMSSLSKLYGKSRLANRIPPVANVVISNVPGPQFALYLAGGEIKTFYPVSIPVHGLALNITLQSYNGSLDFGFIVGAKAVPHVRDMSRFLVEAFEELKACALKDVEPAKPPLSTQPSKRAPRNKASPKAAAEKNQPVQKLARKSPRKATPRPVRKVA